MKLHTYADFRRAGYDPVSSLRNAKRCAEFKRLYDADLVRINADGEQDNYFSIYGEPDGYTDIHGKRHSAEDERKEIESQLEHWGCVVVFSQYRATTEDEWETADSVGMCVYANPLDPLQNCYVPDLWSSAVDAFNALAVAPNL